MGNIVAILVVIALVWAVSKPTPKTYIPGAICVTRDSGATRCINTNAFIKRFPSNKTQNEISHALTNSAKSLSLMKGESGAYIQCGPRAVLTAVKLTDPTDLAAFKFCDKAVNQVIMHDYQLHDVDIPIDMNMGSLPGGSATIPPFVDPHFTAVAQQAVAKQDNAFVLLDTTGNATSGAASLLGEAFKFIVKVGVALGVEKTIEAGAKAGYEAIKAQFSDPDPSEEKPTQETRITAMETGSRAIGNTVVRTSTEVIESAPITEEQPDGTTAKVTEQSSSETTTEYSINRESLDLKEKKSVTETTNTKTTEREDKTKTVETSKIRTEKDSSGKTTVTDLGGSKEEYGSDGKVISKEDIPAKETPTNSAQMVVGGEEGYAISTSTSARFTWEQLKISCGRSGWSTYSCKKWVADRSGCADPGVLTPSPNGNYVCGHRASTPEEEAKWAQMYCEKSRGLMTFREGGGTCNVRKSHGSKPKWSFDPCSDPAATPSPDGCGVKLKFPIFGPGSSPPLPPKPVVPTGPVYKSNIFDTH